MLVLAAALASLAQSEFILKSTSLLKPTRPASERPFYDPESTYLAGYIAQDPLLGARAHPGASWSRRLTPGGEEIYHVVYTIGADGFRVTPNNPTAGPVDVNFFGGSFVFGEGVEDNETLPFYFRELAGGVRVKNYGFHGYGLHQALALLEGDFDTQAKINFVLTGAFHAARSACIPSFARNSPRYVIAPDGEPKLVGRCRFGTGFDGVDRVLRASRLYQRIRTLLAPTQDARFKLYTAIVREMKQISDQRGQRFVVGYLNSAKNFFVDPEWSDERIREELRDSGIQVLDLTLGNTLGDLPREYYLHELDRHPTKLANQRRARLLLDFLSDSEGSGEEAETHRSSEIP